MRNFGKTKAVKMGGSGGVGRTSSRVRGGTVEPQRLRNVIGLRVW
jgi:hypothetical protein